MFKLFTERARQVVVLAQDEARALRHNYIGTEHLLLGLLREEDGLAARVLEGLDVTVEEVRVQVARVVGQGDEVTTGQIPFTPRAKKTLELATREAVALGHDFVGTEHILLGLVRENDGVAARILFDLGADAEKIRNEIIAMLGGPRQAPNARDEDPEIEQIRVEKEAALEAQDFPRAASLRDKERRLLQTRAPPPGTSVSHHTLRPLPGRKAWLRRRWAQWSSMVTGAALLGLGILIGRLIWG